MTKPYRRLTRWLAGLIFMSSFLAACSEAATPGPATIADRNNTITGTLLEKLDRPPYSYLRLRTETGEIWAAVPVAFVAKDKPVTVLNGVALKNYSAGPLGRRFDVVYFGTLEQAR